MAGPVRALTEEEVRAFVRTRMDGVCKAETKVVRRTRLKAALEEWCVVFPEAVSADLFHAILDRSHGSILLEGQPCGHCGLVGRLTCWPGLDRLTLCPCCGGDLVHEYFST
jgi:hypothetical protein